MDAMNTDAGNQPEFAYNPQTHEGFRWNERYQQWEPFDLQQQLAQQKTQAVGEALGPAGTFSESALNTFFSPSRGLAKLLPELAAIGARTTPNWALPYIQPSDQNRQLIQAGEQVNPAAAFAGSVAGAAPIAAIPGGLPTQIVTSGFLGGLQALGEDQNPMQGALRAMAVVGSLGLIAKGIGYAGGKIAERAGRGRAISQTLANMTPEEQAAAAAGRMPEGMGEATGADINRLFQRSAMTDIAEQKYGFRVAPSYSTADPNLRLAEAWMARTPGMATTVEPYIKGNQRILANIGLRAMNDIPTGEINPFVVQRWASELSDTFDAATKVARPIPATQMKDIMEHALDKAGIAPMFGDQAERTMLGYIKRFGKMVSPEELGAMQQDLGAHAAKVAANDGTVAARHLYALHDAALDALRSTMPEAQQAAFDVARQRFRLVRVFQQPGVVAPGGELNLPTLTRHLEKAFKAKSPTLPEIRNFVDASRTLREISSTVPQTGMIPGQYHGITGTAAGVALKTLAPAIRKTYELGAGLL